MYYHYLYFFIRPSASSLLTHAFITDHAMPQRGGHSRSGGSLYPILTSPFQSIVRCSLLPIQTANSQEGGASPAGTTTSTSDHIRERPLQEVYYLWSLAGGDLELEMKKVGLIPSKPPIFSVPRYHSNSVVSTEGFQVHFSFGYLILCKNYPFGKTFFFYANSNPYL